MIADVREYSLSIGITDSEKPITPDEIKNAKDQLIKWMLEKGNYFSIYYYSRLFSVGSFARDETSYSIDGVIGAFDRWAELASFCDNPRCRKQRGRQKQKAPQKTTHVFRISNGRKE